MVLVGSGLTESLQGLGVLWKRCIGYRNAQAATPPNSAVLFFAASSSKPNILQVGSFPLIFKAFSEGLPSLSTCSVGWRVANISLCFGCWSLIFKTLGVPLGTLPAFSFGWLETMNSSLAKLLLLLLLIFRGGFLVLARKRSFLVGFSQLLLRVRRDGEIGSDVFQQAGAAHNLPFISG